MVLGVWPIGLETEVARSREVKTKTIPGNGKVDLLVVELGLICCDGFPSEE